MYYYDHSISNYHYDYYEHTNDKHHSYDRYSFDKHIISRILPLTAIITLSILIYSLLSINTYVISYSYLRYRHYNSSSGGAPPRGPCS